MNPHRDLLTLAYLLLKRNIFGIYNEGNQFLKKKKKFYPPCVPVDAAVLSAVGAKSLGLEAFSSTFFTADLSAIGDKGWEVLVAGTCELMFFRKFKVRKQKLG